MSLYLGIDFGTSGARCTVIDSLEQIQVTGRYPFDIAACGVPTCWQAALFSLFEQIPLLLRQDIEAIAINGTSSTVMLCDATGNPVDVPLLYNDARGAVMLEKLYEIAPPHHTVLSTTSTLVKLLWMLKLPSASKAKFVLHQADWLAFLLHGIIGISDYHNALKLGYDVDNLNYPKWLEKLNLAVELPQVLTPGSVMAPVLPEIINRYGFSRSCVVCAGTTDSIAAFIASGATKPGEGVTSLGSTLAIKLLSHQKIENSQYGIYSHRFPNFRKQDTQQKLWLVGGASNTGGAVLRQFFSSDELESLSSKIDATKTSHLDYYPLIKPGERFPINDDSLKPRLEPRPNDDVEFLHGLLESIARIEARGYELLQQLGANTLSRVYTAGGGAANKAWTEIRRRHLKVAVQPSINTEAAYGTALLAKLGRQGLEA